MQKSNQLLSASNDLEADNLQIRKKAYNLEQCSVLVTEKINLEEQVITIEQRKFDIEAEMEDVEEGSKKKNRLQKNWQQTEAKLKKLEVRIETLGDKITGTL